jgi:hypothetical protein
MLIWLEDLEGLERARNLSDVLSFHNPRRRRSG